jgi:hypothetical protein
MSTQRTYVNTDIDFEQDRKQVSILRLPYSQHPAAWGISPIPIGVILSLSYLQVPGLLSANGVQAV